MPFLLITFIVYALLPDSNVHRRALMFYVLNLLLGYIAMVKVQLSDEYIYPVPCGILAYSIIFFFMVSFCWMNVMCIDMWLAFRGMSGDSGRRGTEKKKMIIYCLYAWCAPAIHTGIVLLINTFANKDLSFYPGIGDEKCFVKDGWPIFMYFYFPMMLVMIVNLILFILTGMKIYRTKKESAVLNRSESRIHHYENHKQQFKLYLTLFFAMGINWSTEFITWALKEHIPQEVVYLTDGINVLYGILIFFIFVFKRRILLSLKKRYYYCIGKPHLAHESSRTRKTVTSTFSNSTVGSSKGNMDYRMEELKNGRLE
ncbi:hypothetical protein JTB14_018184 [Gonioctena quinquepunctata]|nr:hypothetical protein JTB14_018184 [Gonioctena quinquepunctata]